MEAFIFIAKAMAGAIIGQGAKDAYGSLRDYLKKNLDMGGPVAMLEDKPDGETEQRLLAERLLDKDAMSHPEFREKVEILVAALKQVQDQPPQANILIEEIKAKEAVFRRIVAEGSAGIRISGVEADKATFENIKAKS